MKRKAARITLVSIGVLLLVVLVAPFLIPVPPLENTRPPQDLADLDSQFVEAGGVNLHVKKFGEGEPVLVLLHGFGASLYSWQGVFDQLSQYGTVIAYDRPAFGLSERPLEWDGQNPYSREAQVDQLFELLDHYGIEKAILVGHSAGGTVAMHAALSHPERVEALILDAPAVYGGGGSPGWLKPFLATPQMRRLGPLIARQVQERGPEMIELAWNDPTQLSRETLELYKKPLQVENWDRALWEFTLASSPASLAESLDRLTLPVLVITGDNDRIVPTEDSKRLSSELPNASLVVIEKSGHLPHEERPEEFLQAVASFLDGLPR